LQFLRTFSPFSRSTSLGSMLLARFTAYTIHCTRLSELVVFTAPSLDRTQWAFSAHGDTSSPLESYPSISSTYRHFWCSALTRHITPSRVALTKSYSFRCTRCTRRRIVLSRMSSTDSFVNYFLLLVHTPTRHSLSYLLDSATLWPISSRTPSIVPDCPRW
jgi:hypothetical protein